MMMAKMPQPVPKPANEIIARRYDHAAQLAPDGAVMEANQP
jgi:hypothetical protein